MSPPNGDEFGSSDGLDFGFPDEILEQIDPLSVATSRLRGAAQAFLTEEQADAVADAAQLADLFALGLPPELLRLTAGDFRSECMSVRLPGIPGAEYIATAADWWAQQAVDAFGGPVSAVGDVNESINRNIQRTLGIPGSGADPLDSRPRARSGLAPGDDGFLVQVPNWQDIFQFNNDAIFDERSKAQRAQDYAEALGRSPTPPALQEVGELLTTLDDLQDEAATLAIVLAIAEKLAGRAIPGVGWVATAADALNVIYAVSSTGTGSSLPGKRGKRAAVDKAKQSSGGLAGRLEEMRRTGSLKLGISDLLQGLQATDSVFGTGIQLGGIVSFLQDSFWLGLRGGEIRARGPVWDPLGFTDAGRSACYRSPTLDQIHPRAYFMMANTALSVWGKAARVAPYIDVLGEPALASLLTGMRMSEQVLGPWLRSGSWVEQVEDALNVMPYVSGGVAEVETRRLKPDEFVKRTQPGVRVAIRNAIGNVQDRGRQGFYDSLVASVGWGLMADIEPTGFVTEQRISGPIRDAALLLEVNKVPLFDLGD